MDEKSLKTRYAKLAQECGDSFSALIKSRKDLWRSMARAYLWWRDCQQATGFLEGLYAEKQIGYHAPKTNAPNFNPLLRLLFDKPTLSTSERSIFNTWSTALKVLHTDHTDNPNRYRSKAEAKLVALIGERGGLVKMASAADKEREQTEEEDVTTKAGAAAISKPPAPSTKQLIEKRALQLVSTKAGTGEINSKEPMRVGENDLIAVLARRLSDGSIVTLGSTYNSDAIKLISQDIAARSISHCRWALNSP